jgi:hypothetical protein
MEYMTDSQGRRVPSEHVSAVDKPRDQTVKSGMTRTFAARDALAEFKSNAWEEMQTFLALSTERRGASWGGKKGNVSLFTYDGRYKLQAAVNDAIQFNEKLQAAKTLVDNRVRRRADGSRSEIKLLVEDAFRVDKRGDINKNRIPGLRRLAIEDSEWRRPCGRSPTASKSPQPRPARAFTSVRRTALTSRHPSTSPPSSETRPGAAPGRLKPKEKDKWLAYRPRGENG